MHHVVHKDLIISLKVIRILPQSLYRLLVNFQLLSLTGLKHKGTHRLCLKLKYFPSAYLYDPSVYFPVDYVVSFIVSLYFLSFDENVSRRLL